MKKIDWYIIKKYWGSFFFTALIFTLIALAIDFTEKAEKFVEASNTLSVSKILVQYHLNYIPFINGLLWPLFSLIAVIFFTSRLAYNSEVISILNAGVSFNRLLRPYLLAAGVLTIFLLIANHFIIPIANKPKLEFERLYIKRPGEGSSSGSNIHFFIAPDTKIYLRNYSSTDSLGYTFRLEQFKGTTLTYMIKAAFIEWNNDSLKSWKIKDYEVRTYVDSIEHIEVFANKEKDTVLNMQPEDFEFYAKQKDLLTTPQLQALVNKERSRGLNPVQSYLSEIYRRTADPFTIFILTIIGVSIAARKIRGGMGLHLALGMSIGAIFVFISKFSVVFSRLPNIHPLFGIWIPNLIFSIVAYQLVKRAQQ